MSTSHYFRAHCQPPVAGTRPVYGTSQAEIPVQHLHGEQIPLNCLADVEHQRRGRD